MPAPTRPAEPLFTPRFAGLWTYAFITFFAAFQLLPAIPFRILELGGSKAEAGWFLSVYTYASAFAAPVTGSIADRIGRRRMLIGASIVFIGFSLAYGLIRHLPLLLVVAAIHGAIWSGIMSAAAAIISDYIPESRRTEGIAWWGLSSITAIAIAPAVGLFMQHRYGWVILCIELATLSVIMAVAALALESPADHEPHAFVASEAWDWRVILVALSLTAFTFGYGGVTSYAAIVAVEPHITPVSIYFTTFAVTIVLIRIFVSPLGDRLGPKPLIYPSLTLMPIAFATLAFAQTRGQMIASAICFGVGMGIAYPAFVTFILGATDARRRARTFGSIIWAFDTGIGTGSLVLGAIGDSFSLGRAFTVAAIVGCFSLPIFALASRRLGERASGPQSADLRSVD
jgi:MFS family permease